MDKAARIYIAGHRGLVGSALVRRNCLCGPGSRKHTFFPFAAGEGRGAGNNHQAPYTNIITRTHAELDLTDQRAVRQFFEQENPEYVFLAAAKVGGIQANNQGEP